MSQYPAPDLRAGAGGVGLSGGTEVNAFPGNGR